MADPRTAHGPERALVIIPTYNERLNIQRIIESVLSQDPRLEVLVVDDGSPDGTGQLVDEMAGRNGRRIVIDGDLDWPWRWIGPVRRIARIGSGIGWMVRRQRSHRRLDRSDRSELGRDDRRWRRFGPGDGEGFGAGQHARRRPAEQRPAGDGDEQETDWRAHCTASFGKMCCVFSQRGVRPPECWEKARNAASTAIRFPTNSRGMESRPSSRP